MQGAAAHQTEHDDQLEGKKDVGLPRVSWVM